MDWFKYFVFKNTKFREDILYRKLKRNFKRKSIRKMAKNSIFKRYKKR